MKSPTLVNGQEILGIIAATILKFVVARQS